MFVDMLIKFLSLRQNANMINMKNTYYIGGQGTKGLIWHLEDKKKYNMEAFDANYTVQVYRFKRTLLP